MFDAIFTAKMWITGSLIVNIRHILHKKGKFFKNMVNLPVEKWIIMCKTFVLQLFFFI